MLAARGAWQDGRRLRALGTLPHVLSGFAADGRFRASRVQLFSEEPRDSAAPGKRVPRCRPNWIDARVRQFECNGGVATDGHRPRCRFDTRTAPSVPGHFRRDLPVEPHHRRFTRVLFMSGMRGVSGQSPARSIPASTFLKTRSPPRRCWSKRGRSSEVTPSKALCDFGSVC